MFWAWEYSNAQYKEEKKSSSIMEIYYHGEI